MYQIKQIPTDFIVREVTTLKKTTWGSHTYILLKKKEKTTLDAVLELAKVLGLREKDIGFAGTKDRNATTQQYLSLKGVFTPQQLAITLAHAEISFVGYGEEPLSLGDLKGNNFEIVVRNLLEQKIKLISSIPNYFDEQRFSEHNVEVGRHLIKKEFYQACELVDKQKFFDHVQKKGHDYVGFLKTFPLRLLRLYVNAYQSYLWNELVSKYLQMRGRVQKEVTYSEGRLVFVENNEMFSSFKIPLLGYLTDLDEISEDLKPLILEILTTENISLEDFIIRQIPTLSLEGEERNLIVFVADFTFSEFEDDDLHVGMKKVTLRFFLPKGSYATIVVKALFS